VACRSARPAAAGLRKAFKKNRLALMERKTVRGFLNDNFRFYGKEKREPCLQGPCEVLKKKTLALMEKKKQTNSPVTAGLFLRWLKFP